LTLQTQTDLPSDRRRSHRPAASAQTNRTLRAAASFVRRQAAHGQRLTHRDIKPDNIWLETAGRVKLVDFGLARANDEQSDLTQSGAIVGTPNFLAPEQARGEVVDHRADLFSLGAVLYQMTTGSSPFSRNSLMATLTAVTLDDPPPPATLDATVPSRLSELIMKLLHKQPSERLQTADEVIDELKLIEAEIAEPIERTVEIKPAPSTSQTQSSGAIWSTGRGKLLLATAASAIVLLLAVVIYVKTDRGTLVVRAGDDFEVVTANQTVKIRDKKTDREFIVQIGANESIPTGDYLVVKDDDGLEFSAAEFTIHRGRNQDLVVSLRDTPRAIVPAGKPTGKPSGKPSGKPLSWFALTSRPESVAGLKTFTIETRYHRGNIYDVGVSSKGDLFATVGYDATLRLWRTDDFHPIQVIHPGVDELGYFRGFAWSIDGWQFAYGYNHHVFVHDTTSWKQIHHFSGTEGELVDNLGWSKSGLLAASFGKSVLVWDVKQGRTLRRRDVDDSSLAQWDGDHDRIAFANGVTWDVGEDRLSAAANPAKKYHFFSADRSLAGMLDFDNSKLVLQSTSDGATIREFPLPKKQPQNSRPRLSANGKYVAWMDYDDGNRERVFDVMTGEELTSSGIEAFNEIARWLPNGTELAIWSTVASVPKTAISKDDHLSLRIVNVETGAVRKGRITQAGREEHPLTVTRIDGPHIQKSIGWSPDDASLFSGGFGLRQWDMKTGRFQDRLLGPESETLWHEWHQDNVIWGTNTNKGVSTFQVDTKNVRSRTGFTNVVGIANGNGRAFDLVDNQTVRVFNTVSGESIGDDLKLPQPLESWGRMSPLGDWIASPSADGQVMRIWSVDDLQKVRIVDGKSLKGDDFLGWSSIHFHADSSRAVLSCSLHSKATQLFLWDLDQNQTIRKIESRANPGRSKWLDDQRFVIASPGVLSFYDRNGALLSEWTGEGVDFSRTALSRDGSKLACLAGTYTEYYGNHAPLIQIRDMSNGDVLSTHCVLPTPDGTDLSLSFGATGHWHGPPEARDALCFVVVTDDGTRLMLTPSEFQDQFDWVNNPNQVLQSVAPETGRE
jgi:WD40 repeat protein